MSNSSKAIKEAFKEYFEIVPATTEVLREHVYKLRYQVYCLEIQGYDPGIFSSGMETDEFDHHCAHYLIRHRQSNEFAATARLILPCQADPARPFPFEEHCRIDRADLLKAIDRRHVAEVSRFCVSKAFKKRNNETPTLATVSPDGGGHLCTEAERRIFPHIALALFAGLIEASHEHGIQYWCASMEASFLRFIALFGVYPVKIGPLADYHGERWPCLIKVSDMLDTVAEKDRQVWELFTDGGRYGSVGG